MRILVDAMGGDHAPLAVLNGCIRAKSELGVTPVLVGNAAVLKNAAESAGIDLSGLEILHAERAIGMDDLPLSVRSIPDSSIRIGLTALSKGQADAFVSAGNTGALQLGANLFVGRINGISRSAIATVLPCKNPVLLLDCGANATFTPELLCEYAAMGSVYMKKVCGVAHPRVGLLNIGSEPYKGTPGHAQTNKLLSELSQIGFVGNIEPAALIEGACDVLVADGFSGNVLLKTMESAVKYTLSKIEDAAKGQSSLERILRQDQTLSARYYGVKKQFDPSEYGGAPFLGIRAPVIKAHGNSDAGAIKNAIRQASLYAAGQVVKEIEQALDGVFCQRNDQ